MNELVTYIFSCVLFLAVVELGIGETRRDPTKMVKIIPYREKSESVLESTVPKLITVQSLPNFNRVFNTNVTLYLFIRRN